MRFTFLIMAPAVLWLVGCVPYEARPLSAEAGGAEFSGRSLEDTGFRSFLAEHKAESGAWTVDRLSLAAAYFHPDVALARAEAAEVSAAIETAQMRPNPVLTFSPQYASSPAVGTPSRSFGLSSSIPFETAGKRSKRTEQAVAAAEAARWRVSSRAWAARSRVRSAMVELYGARENSRLLETEETLHNQAIQKLAAQMEAGEVSPFELTQARLKLNHTRLTLLDARRLAATSEARLAAAVGLPLKAMKELSLDFAFFLKLPEPTNSYDLALNQRADLMARLAEYAAAEAALKLELAKQYPDVNLLPGYDYNYGQSRWQLGLNFTLPLNQNQGPIAEAEARRFTAEKRFLAQQATVRGELDIALVAYQASRAKAATANQLAQEAERAAATTQMMVAAGNVSALELTRRQIEANAAKIALLAAKSEAQAALGALEDARQSPLR